MRTTILLFALTTVLFWSSCRKDDAFKGEAITLPKPSFDTETVLGQKAKTMYETYDVYFRTDFTAEDFGWDWTKMVHVAKPGGTGVSYTKADVSKGVEIIDSVDNWVFKIFPIEFSKKYMARTVLMVDTMERILSGLDDKMEHIMYEGYMLNNYLMIPYVSSRFDPLKDKRLLRESWLSLFIEKATVGMPAIPLAFSESSQAGYNQVSMWNTTDVTKTYAILKRARTKERSILTASLQGWDMTTKEQDFGDFVAFIVYTPEAEKQQTYLKNVNIEKKVKVVKQYFKENFDIELPYKPINN